jgi:hypothetical protein
MFFSGVGKDIRTSSRAAEKRLLRRQNPGLRSLTRCSLGCYMASLQDFD